MRFYYTFESDCQNDLLEFFGLYDLSHTFSNLMYMVGYGDNEPKIIYIGEMRNSDFWVHTVRFKDSLKDIAYWINTIAPYESHVRHVRENNWFDRMIWLAMDGPQDTICKKVDHFLPGVIERDAFIGDLKCHIADFSVI